MPVIARDAGAVAEVVGDAGVLVDGDDGPATVAELLRIVVADSELRGELRRRGERRLASTTTTGQRRCVLRETVIGLAAA